MQNGVRDKIQSDQPPQPIDKQERDGLYELRDYFWGRIPNYEKHKHIRLIRFISFFTFM